MGGPPSAAAGREAALLCSQAAALRQAGQVDASLSHYRRVLSLAPAIGSGDAAGLLAIGAALAGLGRLAAAIAHYEKLLPRLPEEALEARRSLAGTIASLRRAHVQRAVDEATQHEIDGCYSPAAHGYAVAVPQSLRAARHLRRLLARFPESAAGLDADDRERVAEHIARARAMAGLMQDGEDFESLWPELDFDSDHLQLMTDLTYRSEDEAYFAKVSGRLGEAYAARAAALVGVRGWQPPAPPPAADGRIRLSWLCVDFAPGQIVWESLTGYFKRHDRQRFQLFVHATNQQARDVAPMLQAWGVVFRDLAGQDDAAVAEAIRDDDIELLADINGYHVDSRPLVLALRPAPVQLLVQSYLRPVYSRFHDYQLTDRHLIPEPVSPFERLIWLPGPSINPWERGQFHPGLPGAAPKPPVRFVAPHQLNKVDAELCGLWADILKAVPDATLTVRAEAATFIARQVAARGVADVARRIVVQPHVAGRHAYLEVLANHHLMLDAMPFSGSATGLDCLAVGVPVLTCETASPMSRIMSGNLIGCGLGHMVCRSREAYRDRAIALGRDPNLLAVERARLCDGHDALPIFDAPRFVAKWERAFAAVHARWRAGLPPDHLDLEAPGGMA